LAKATEVKLAASQFGYIPLSRQYIISAALATVAKPLLVYSLSVSISISIPPSYILNDVAQHTTLSLCNIQ